MKKFQVLLATGAILSAALGGMIVWSYMTYTIEERVVLAGLKADQAALAECVTERAAIVSEVTDAKAEAEALKTSSR